MSKLTELSTEIKRISDNKYDVTEINSAVTNIEKILNYYGIVLGRTKSNVCCQSKR